MTPKLYYAQMSPASRAVLVTERALGIELEKQTVNLAAGEQMEPEFLKMNPQHTVPTLRDGDFVVWDSHAISAYLVGRYGAGAGDDDSSPLYPRDLQKRAVVDQRLHFDSGVLFPRLAAIVGPIFREGARSVPKDKSDAVHAGYAFLEEFLRGSRFAAGDSLTLADFHLATTVTQLNALVPIASNRYPEISRWLGELRAAAPYFDEVNQPGVDVFDKFVKSRLS